VNKLQEAYKAVRARTEELCEPLTIEDYNPQAAGFVSPPKWHLAHTTWFFEEMILSKYLSDYSCHDESYRYLFNSYYNAVGDRIQREERGLISRPSVEEVYHYRKVVDEFMVELIRSGADDINKLIVLGLNHEQQHQELLLTDLKYTWSKNPTYPVYKKSSFEKSVNEESGWLSVEEGVYEIGHEGELFSFDNEHGRHKVFLQSFEIAKGLVTNREFIEFIQSGAYDCPDLWLDEGWYWICQEQVSAPLYWKKKGNEWFQYTLSGLVQVDLNDVLTHVSHYEAMAFAAFKGARLPTEFEWELASRELKWGQRWEWTNSAYLPYPEFEIAAGAVGEYNGKFMSNQMVLRGGSIATSDGHSRPTYRNFFHPSMRWQFNGIRLAK
jgi:ergothioneine biosynthesis protein EgtB